MPVHIGWDDPEQMVLRYDLSGRWTWEEFAACYKEGVALIQGRTDKINYIVNPLDSISRNYVPTSAFIQSLNMSRGGPQHQWGCTIIVSDSRFLRSIYDMGKRLYPRLTQHYQFADSLEEARARIASLFPEKITPSEPGG